MLLHPYLTAPYSLLPPDLSCLSCTLTSISGFTLEERAVHPSCGRLGTNDYPGITPGPLILWKQPSLSSTKLLPSRRKSLWLIYAGSANTGTHLILLWPLSGENIPVHFFFFWKNITFCLKDIHLSTVVAQFMEGGLKPNSDCQKLGVQFTSCCRSSWTWNMTCIPRLMLCASRIIQKNLCSFHPECKLE